MLSKLLFLFSCLVLLASSRYYVDCKSLEVLDDAELTTMILDRREKFQDVRGRSDVPVYDDEECQEGSVLTILCNTCVCSDKKYFCSKKDCRIQKPLPPLPPLSSSGIKKKMEYKNPGNGDLNKFVDSEDDKVYGLDSASGTSTASKLNIMMPMSQDKKEDMMMMKLTNPTQVCSPGHTRRVDCNHCICSTQGEWSCTKDKCIALNLREKASFKGEDFLKKAGNLKEEPELDEDCVEADVKIKKCNHCICHRQAWVCTQNECPKETFQEMKKPFTRREPCTIEEDVKSKDCNICSCRKGIWVCTTNDCKKFGNRYYHPIVRTRNSVAPIKP